MKIGTVKILRIVLTFGTLALALLGKLFLKASVVLGGAFVVLALAAIIGEIVITMLFWKCPCCERHLHRRLLFAKHCTHCGASLED